MLSLAEERSSGTKMKLVFMSAERKTGICSRIFIVCYVTNGELHLGFYFFHKDGL